MQWHNVPLEVMIMAFWDVTLSLVPAFWWNVLAVSILRVYENRQQVPTKCWQSSH
jgi:hypothetical protein